MILYKADIYNTETGEVMKEDLTLGDLSNIIKKNDEFEKARYYKKLFYLLENNPSKLSLDEIKDIAKIRGVAGIRKVNSFERYHQRNDSPKISIFDLVISHRAFYYFGMLIEKCCNTKYTIVTNNEVNIKTDKKIGEVLGIKPSTWSNVKKELLSLNLLRVGRFNNEKYYKVNPCYIGKRNELSESTYYLFRDELIKNEMLDEFRILYWDRLLYEEYNVSFPSRK